MADFFCFMEEEIDFQQSMADFFCSMEGEIAFEAGTLRTTDLWLDGNESKEVVFSDLRNYGEPNPPENWREISCLTPMSRAEGGIQNSSVTLHPNFDSFYEGWPTNISGDYGLPTFNGRDSGSSPCVGQNSRFYQNCFTEDSFNLASRDISSVMGMNGDDGGIQKSSNNSNSYVTSYSSCFAEDSSPLKNFNSCEILPELFQQDSFNLELDINSLGFEPYPQNHFWVDSSKGGEMVHLAQNIGLANHSEQNYDTGSSTYSERSCDGYLPQDLMATSFMLQNSQLPMSHGSTTFTVDPTSRSGMQTGNAMHNYSMETANNNKRNRPIIEENASPKTDHKRIKRNRWTEEENKLLQILVEQFGENWNKIKEDMPQRTAKQCRDRWTNHLKQDIEKGPWTDEEENILIQAHHELGNKWTNIAKRLPGRTENTTKNHWYSANRQKFPNASDPTSSKYSKSTNNLQNYIKSLPRNSSRQPPLVMDAIGDDKKCFVFWKDLEDPRNKRILNAEAIETFEDFCLFWNL